jgi:hypothetical protein
MTDEELIKALRGYNTSTSIDDDAHEAADRIEQLVATNEQLVKEEARLNAGWHDANDRALNTGLKLAKAVYALRLVVTAKGLTNPTEYGYDAIVSARAILAELEKTE